MLKVKSNFAQVSNDIPAIPDKTALSAKDKLLQAFKNDINTALKKIQTTLQNSSPENQEKHLKNLSDFLEENPALLLVIEPFFDMIMSPEQRERLYELSSFKKPEELSLGLA